MRSPVTLPLLARKIGVIIVPPMVVAGIGAAIAVRLGDEAVRGSGVALLGLGVVMMLSMGTAGGEAISGWEMRMDGREPQGLRGRRWVENVWSTGADDPRGLPQYDPSIDRWLVAGIAYAGLGTAILMLL